MAFKPKTRGRPSIYAFATPATDTNELMRFISAAEPRSDQDVGGEGTFWSKAHSILSSDYGTLFQNYILSGNNFTNVGGLITEVTYTNVHNVAVEATYTLNSSITLNSTDVSDLHHSEYRELGAALSALANEESSDLADDQDLAEERIEPAVYAVAAYVASELERDALPAPKLFNHGPRSVVFTWEGGGKSLLITVSEQKLGVLVSTPEKILRRMSFDRIRSPGSGLLLSALSSEYLGGSNEIKDAPETTKLEP